MITNEHAENLERTEPKAGDMARVRIGIQMLSEAREMLVKSRSGTDLVVDLTDASSGETPGFGTHPGAVANWPGGLCLAFPGKGALNGRT